MEGREPNKGKHGIHWIVELLFWEMHVDDYVK
jgi:hypothetical protein